MLSVSQALSAIVAHAEPLPAEEISLCEARGRRLTQEIISGIDSPPFDKSLMDGFALQAAETASGEVTLRILETLAAGQTPSRPVSPGGAIRIMTGAPLPEGADAVIPVEQTEPGPDEEHVRLRAAVAPGANLIRQGTSMRAGEVIFAPGHCLRGQDLALLAELGATRPRVRQIPRVAVLATGDELVPPEVSPGPGQIRNSNETLLVEFVEAAGATAVPLGIARDDPADLRKKIERGLECDVLLLSGGVSAGMLDLVPGVLKECGVREVFHKANLKPGKPIWFGTKNDADDRRRLVFGLPGNPVSSLVCFELFVRTALRRLAGQEPTEVPTIPATLEEAIPTRGNRAVYFPCALRFDDRGQLIARPVRWAGSSDLRATTKANGMVVIEPEQEAGASAKLPAIVWSGNDINSEPAKPDPGCAPDDRAHPMFSTR